MSYRARILSRNRLVGLCLLAGAALLLTGHAVAGDETELDPREVLDQAKVKAGAIPDQALALARHAWPDEPMPHAVSRLARKELIEFGMDGFGALRWAVVNAPTRYQPDAVAAMLESRDRLPHEIPPDYLPALEEAVWFGSVEAKRLSLSELTAHRYPPALMSMIDAAYEYSSIRLDVIESVGRYRSDRVRHFLLKMMREGSDEEASAAADGLARIGDRALGTLRAALDDEVAQARNAAARALLPISNVEDLSRLHEFVALQKGADPQLVEDIRQRTELLELVLERKLAAEAATAPY